MLSKKIRNTAITLETRLPGMDSCARELVKSYLIDWYGVLENMGSRSAHNLAIQCITLTEKIKRETIEPTQLVDELFRLARKAEDIEKLDSVPTATIEYIHTTPMPLSARR